MRAVRYVPSQISQDTVECLTALLEQAKRGEVLGMVAGVVLKRSRYSVHLAGEAKRNPTYARGIIAVLDDRAAAEIHSCGLL